jgi:hypothetical protein
VMLVDTTERRPAVVIAVPFGDSVSQT